MSEEIDAIAKLICPGAFRKGQTDMERLITGQYRADARKIASEVLPALAAARTAGRVEGLRNGAEMIRTANLKTRDVFFAQAELTDILGAEADRIEKGGE
jgi:hypothetical protein